MVGRVIVLLLLIAVMSFGGIIWFDYLNVIDAKTTLAPFYKYVPFIQGEGRTQPLIEEDELINLNDERLAIRLEALELLNMEMETQKKDLGEKYGEIERMANELEERQKELDDREKTFIADRANADDKSRNVEQNARYLTGMPPQNAVNILASLDDQDAIDVLRKTEEIARAEGTTSVVAYWFSLMEPKRAAELQRKMAGRPASL